MTKTRKGRFGTASKPPARPRTTSARQVVEVAKTNSTKSDKVDVTTIADDDPTSLRNKVRGFLTLMGDDSSDEEEAGNDHGQSITPRRCDDKKRQ